jgi:CubicO group peptidase (beta-lactamase class C family)
MVAALELAQIVREARAKTRVPGVAAGLWRDGEVVAAADGVLELGRDEPVRAETPFRIASISKPFTASLALSCLPLGERLVALLSHTAGLRPESAAPLPAEAEGLFSYSNSGYWEAGKAVERACGGSFEDAMRTRLLEPLGLAATGYAQPRRAARGHVQEGETGHRAVPLDSYPVARRPSGGLWSTVGDLLAFAAHHLGGPGPLSVATRASMREPWSQALGGGYGLGWWRREAGGRLTLDHEGSTAGYQSLLLLAPDDGLALAVLTNSWRGSGLIRRVGAELGLAPKLPGTTAARGDATAVAGQYGLDGMEAVVAAEGDGLRIEESETDPVTGTPTSRRYGVRPIGGDVYGFAGGTLMSHRIDFPRPNVARIGWVAMPRVGP